MNSDQCVSRIVHQEKIDLARSQDLDPREVEKLCQLFKAFSEPGRLRILHALLKQEMCVCDLAALLAERLTVGGVGLPGESSLTPRPLSSIAPEKMIVPAVWFVTRTDRPAAVVEIVAPIETLPVPPVMLTPPLLAF